MAHPPSRRCGLACDEPNDRLGQVLLDISGGLLLVRASDLTDDDYRLGLGVILKSLETIDEVRPDDRVACDPDAGALTYPGVVELEDDLVGQGTCPGDDTYRSRLGDLARHDPDLRFTWREGTWAVRT